MTELCVVDAGLSSMEQVETLLEQRGHDAYALHRLILHGNAIATLASELLVRTAHLTHLDLSSNRIERIDGLDALGQLRYLSLMNNDVRRIDGLRALHRLVCLNLAYNRIATLDGIEQLHGDAYRLALIDLRGNQLSDVRDLLMLAGCPGLRHVAVTVEQCADDELSQRLFRSLPRLVSCNGRTRSGEDASDAIDAVMMQQSGNDLDLDRPVESETRRPPSPTPVMPSIQKALGRKKVLSSNTAHSSRPDGDSEKENVDLIQIENRVAELRREMLVAQKKDASTSVRASPTPKLKPSKRPTTPPSDASSCHSAHRNESLMLVKQLESITNEYTSLQNHNNQLLSTNKELAAENERLLSGLKKLLKKHEELDEARRQLEKSASEEKNEKEALVASLKKLTRLHQKTCASLQEAKEKEQHATEKQIKFQADLELQKSENTKLIDECQRMRTQKANDHLAAQLRKSEEERTKMALKFIKEKETRKNEKDLETYRVTVHQLQKEVKQLQDTIIVKDEDHRRQLRDLAAAHASELQSMVDDTSQTLRKEYEARILQLSRDFETEKAELFKAHETLQTSLTESESKLSHLRQAFQESSRVLAEQKEAICSSQEKETDLRKIIDEQSKELETTRKNCQAVTLEYQKFQQQCSDLSGIARRQEAELTRYRKFSDEVHVQFAEYQKDIERQKETIENLLQTSEKEKLDYETKIVNIEKELEEVRRSLEDAQKNITAKDQNSSQVETALRVKEKMLDDQNNTISKLKKDLAVKVTEFNVVSEELQRMKEELKHIEASAIQDRTNFKKELKRYKKTTERLETMLEEYKDERDALKTENVELIKKIQAQETSITIIEDEVANVRQVFESKLEAAKEQHRQTLSMREADVSRLMNQLQTLQSDNLQLETQKNTLDLALKAKMDELNQMMEQQKKVAAKKMERMRAMVMEE